MRANFTPILDMTSHTSRHLLRIAPSILAANLAS
jgi:hypothetical protein